MKLIDLCGVIVKDNLIIKTPNYSVNIIDADNLYEDNEDLLERKVKLVYAEKNNLVVLVD